jgi:hypothetical protein
MSEVILMREIQVDAPRADARLFRNNVALAWVGKLLRAPRPVQVTLNPSDILLRNARPLHAGLCEGSSDLIGWRTLTITPEMVGRRVAIFATVEVKTGTGRTTKQQKAWLKAVGDAGGIAVEARSRDEAMRGLDGGGQYSKT